MAVAYTQEDCDWVIMQLCGQCYDSNLLVETFRKDLTDCPFPVQHLGIDVCSQVRIAILIPRVYLIKQLQRKISYYSDISSVFYNPNANTFGVVVRRDYAFRYMFEGWCFHRNIKVGTIHFEKSWNNTF